MGTPRIGGNGSRKYSIAWTSEDGNIHNVGANSKLMAAELAKDLFRSAATMHMELSYRGTVIGIWFRDKADAFELEKAFLFFLNPKEGSYG